MIKLVIEYHAIICSLRELILLFPFYLDRVAVKVIGSIELLYFVVLIRGETAKEASFGVTTPTLATYCG